MISFFSTQSENQITDTSVDDFSLGARATIASVQLTVSGNRYVFVGLTDGYALLTPGGSAHTYTTIIYIVRDSTDIGQFPLQGYSGGAASTATYPNAGQIFLFDRPAKGTYTYKLDAQSVLSAGTGGVDLAWSGTPTFLAKEFIF